MKKSEYDNQYAKENYDRIIVQVKKGKKELIKTYAKNKGYESVNAYINTLIERDMERTEEKQGIHIQNSNGIGIGGNNNNGIVIGDNKGNINM